MTLMTHMKGYQQTTQYNSHSRQQVAFYKEVLASPLPGPDDPEARWGGGGDTHNTIKNEITPHAHGDGIHPQAH